MTRRCWLAAAGATLAAPGVRAAPKEATAVRVTGLEVFRVPVNRLGNWVLFRLHTDAGLTGVGDASHGSRDDSRIASLGRDLLEAFGKRSIFDVEHLRQIALPRVRELGRPAAVALGGLEQCLWDLQGTALGVPVCQLFGGALRRKLRCYANINRSTEERTPAGFARMAQKAVRAGFDAVKLAPFDGMARLSAPREEFERDTRRGIECIAAVREAVGPDVDVLVDAHNHFDLERGLELARRLEPYRLFWLEEVSRDLAALAAVNREAPMPTAGGESVFGVRGFHAYMKADPVDILMPDIKYCGGMLELKKIAAMAEGAGLPVAPHGVASPVGHLAAAHVAATLPNFLILEYSYGEVRWRADLVEPPEAIEGGSVRVTGRPGLGCALNETTIRKRGAKLLSV